MFVYFTLFIIGILGFSLNKKNIILMLISIEIMLLAITLIILSHSLMFEDIFGQVFAIYIIVIAAAESAIAVDILVAFYRLRGSIALYVIYIYICVYQNDQILGVTEIEE